VNITIMRVFSRLRRLFADQEALAGALHDVKVTCDLRFSQVSEALQELMEPPQKLRRERIGFRPPRIRPRSLGTRIRDP
jgi:hypothetical protein